MKNLKFEEKYKKWGNVELGDDQIEAIEFLLKRKGAICSLQTGLGKTLSVLVANKIFLDNNPEYKTIIVCPVKALKSFKRELNRMKYKRNEVGIIATNEMEYDVKTNKIFVFTDTNIKKYIELVAEIVARGNRLVLIVDEAHKLQDTNSKFYQTMIEVRSVCDIVWLSTATPLLNGLDSLYWIVDFAVQGFLGRKTDFDNRYTEWHLKDQYVRGGGKRKIKVIDNYINLNELNYRLKDIMIVKKKEYNLKFSNIQKRMTEEEYEIYEKVSSGIFNKDMDERNFSRRLHDLQRFIDNSYENDESIKKLVKDIKKDNEISTKETVLIDTLKDCLERNYNTIIYSDYKEVLNRIEKVLKCNKEYIGYNKIYKINGNINISTREKIEEQLDKNDVVLITSAGTESINLQKCNCFIFYDIPFSIKQIIQAVGRICRRDSKFKYQYCIFITMEETVDEYKFRLFQNHLNLVQQSVGAGADIPLNKEYLTHGSNDIKELKDTLLWKYKGTRRKRNSLKREIKEKISTCTTSESKNILAVNKFLIEDIPCNDTSVKRVNVLFPDNEDYYKYVNNLIPYTVLRSHYIEYLKSPRGKRIIENIIKGVHETGDLVLVGDTNLKDDLLDEIILYVTNNKINM